MTITPDAIRRCFEGVIPAVIATCAPDGTPNVAYLSQVHFVDNAHVALSFQFFNKTRENILVNPYAEVQVIDPDTAIHYRLLLKYLRTETEGPLFEYMKAKLAGIASHTGMSKVFRLLGSDIYQVLRIEALPIGTPGDIAPTRSRLAALRRSVQRLSACPDLNSLFEELMRCLQQEFVIEHAMLLMSDERGECLYTVASCGYAASGIGSEIPIGTGVIGVAARERTPIRIMHMTGEYIYSRAMRDSLMASGVYADIETEIPFPGLTAPHSQLAVPITSSKHLFGILYVESDQELRFTFEDEDALLALANQLALMLQIQQQPSEITDEKATLAAPTPVPIGTPIVIRHYAINHSVFIDNEYLIKGVAGAILWKLLNDYITHQRTQFSNRQLRLDPTLKLPEICDNLETRLILLQKRLNERCAFIRLEKTGRGRFSLQVDRPINLCESTDAVAN